MMIDDRHLDGNALGGLLHDMFGREMTDQLGCCGNCGAIAQLGATIVYMDAPGNVVRCSACGAVLLVAVSMPRGLRVTMQSLRWIEMADRN